MIGLQDYEAPSWFPNHHKIMNNNNHNSYTIDKNINRNTDNNNAISNPMHTRDTNIEQIMKMKGFTSYLQFYNWSIDMNTCQEYWDICIRHRLNMQFQTPYTKVFDMSATNGDDVNDTLYGIKSVQYLSDAKFNIADSCFPVEYMKPPASTTTPPPPAIVYANDNDTTLHYWSHIELNRLTNRIAMALVSPDIGVKVGDSIGICMPMSPESVAIYLAIIKVGCAVVSIADSFSAIEIQTRMRLANAKVMPSPVMHIYIYNTVIFVIVCGGVYGLALC